MPGMRTAYVISKVDVMALISREGFNISKWDFRKVKGDLRTIELPGKATKPEFIRQNIKPLLRQLAPDIRSIVIPEHDLIDFVSSRLTDRENNCQLFHWQVDPKSKFTSRTVVAGKQNLDFVPTLNSLPKFTWSTVAFTDIPKGKVRLNINREPTAMIYRWKGDETDYEQTKRDFEDFLNTLIKSGKV